MYACLDVWRLHLMGSQGRSVWGGDTRVETARIRCVGTVFRQLEQNVQRPGGGSEFGIFKKQQNNQTDWRINKGCGCDGHQIRKSVRGRAMQSLKGHGTQCRFYYSWIGSHWRPWRKLVQSFHNHRMWTIGVRKGAGGKSFWGILDGKMGRIFSPALINKSYVSAWKSFLELTCFEKAVLITMLPVARVSWPVSWC